jgi:hypothetical protein
MEASASTTSLSSLFFRSTFAIFPSSFPHFDRLTLQQQHLNLLQHHYCVVLATRPPSGAATQASSSLDIQRSCTRRTRSTAPLANSWPFQTALDNHFSDNVTNTSFSPRYVLCSNDFWRGPLFVRPISLLIDAKEVLATLYVARWMLRGHSTIVYALVWKVRGNKGK